VSDLKGLKYTPLFDFFAAKYPKAFQMLNDPYVTADSGTGIVHQAPAFGEDDYRVCIGAGIVVKGMELPCPLSPDGAFVAPVDPEWIGLNVKVADKAIIKRLRENGRLINHSTLTHSYPFCWRSDTPLIYRAISSWFVEVESLRDRLVASNAQTHWVPDNVKTGRFNNWLEKANDWAIGRSRYWGTPLPIWTNEDFSETIAIGSIEELERLSGVKGITDLHRHFVDKIEIPAPSGNGMLKRVDEVFDCWFESGSMPYGQAHYPFENKEAFERTFPADFIAEGLDQTRGWFYTLMVLSTALFDKPAFKNNIVNGIVKAEDGKKMSKRLMNYPDPTIVVDKYGADALRLYLVNSPVVRAQDLSFKEAGVKGVIRDVTLPWYNSYRFFVQNAKRFPTDTGKDFVPNPDITSTASNIMDKWVLAALQSVVRLHHRATSPTPACACVRGASFTACVLGAHRALRDRQRVQALQRRAEAALLPRPDDELVHPPQPRSPEGQRDQRGRVARLPVDAVHGPGHDLQGHVSDDAVHRRVHVPGPPPPRSPNAR
jgi:isoleucyl-tRNA synthetase